MSITACLHLVESSKRDYRPSVDALRSISHYLHITDFNVVELYDRTLNWEDEDNEDEPLQRFEKLTLDQALNAYRQYLESSSTRSPIRLLAKFNEWAHQFADHFDYLPADVSGHYAPADFAFVIGNADIPSVDFERVQATSTFQIEMYGNQMPIRFDDYIDALLKDEIMRQFLEFLSTLDGGLQFRAYMSAYY